MPTISMFYGILIRMHKHEHNPPHFHAKYGEFEASFDFDGEITEGQFPPKQTALVKSWALIHTDELNANWELLGTDEQLYRIPPLQ